MWTFTIVVISIIAVIGFFKWHRANQDPLTLMANNNRKMWVENHKSELGLDNYFSDDDDDYFERILSPNYSWSCGNINYNDDDSIFDNDFSRLKF
jgi:hypothetical protein